MKYVKQFFMILMICLAGELCRYLIPLPVPASIYGLVLMLLCLLTGIIKLRQVDEAATFLVSIMPVMFIPAGVGLMRSFSILRPHLLAIVITTILTTVLVMGVTGILAQCIIRRTGQSEKEES